MDKSIHPSLTDLSALLDAKVEAVISRVDAAVARVNAAHAEHSREMAQRESRIEKTLSDIKSEMKHRDAEIRAEMTQRDSAAAKRETGMLRLNIVVMAVGVGMIGVLMALFEFAR